MSADAQHDTAQGAPEAKGIGAFVQSPRGKAALAALGLIVLVWAGYSLLSYWTYGRFQVSTDNAYLAADSVVVAPRVSGYIAEVLVEDGADVNAGDLLARIDAGPLEAAAARANADLERALAELARHEAEILLVRAQASEAQSAATLAEAQAARYGALADAGAERRETSDTYSAEAAQALARRAGASARVEAAERQSIALSAQVAQARAALTQAELDLAATRLLAPQAARVGDLSVRVGQYVQPGARLMTLVPTQQLYIIANFKETQVGAMRPGQSVRIDVDALPGEDLEGVIEAIAPGTGSEFALIAPDNATGNFTKIVQRVPVRIRIEATAAVRTRLIAGLSATVSVDTRSPR